MGSYFSKSNSDDTEIQEETSVSYVSNVKKEDIDKYLTPLLVDFPHVENNIQLVGTNPTFEQRVKEFGETGFPDKEYFNKDKVAYDVLCHYLVTTESRDDDGALKCKELDVEYIVSNDEECKTHEIWMSYDGQICDIMLTNDNGVLSINDEYKNLQCIETLMDDLGIDKTTFKMRQLVGALVGKLEIPKPLWHVYSLVHQKLNFSHPTKDLTWAIDPNSSHPTTKFTWGPLKDTATK